MSVFSERLKLIMAEKSITQAQLAKMTSIPKSAINQYLSDRFKPRRDRTEVLCRALDVNPAWLVGLVDTRCQFSENGITAVLSPFEYELISSIRKDAVLFEEVRVCLSKRADDDMMFRAAKSADGNVPPLHISADPERLVILGTAPETDEDL